MLFRSFRKPCNNAIATEEILPIKRTLATEISDKTAVLFHCLTVFRVSSRVDKVKTVSEASHCLQAVFHCSFVSRDIHPISITTYNHHIKWGEFFYQLFAKCRAVSRDIAGTYNAQQSFVLQVYVSFLVEEYRAIATKTAFTPTSAQR